MIMKIFYGLVALICVFLLFDAARMGQARYVAGKADESFIQEPQSADLEVVEFLDYSCPTCRSLHPTVKRAIERDGRIRHVVRPIVPMQDNDIGMKAAALAFSAGKQGKFFEAHNMLIENYRNINDAYIEQFAKTLDLNEEQLRRDMNDPDIRKDLIKNQKILNNLKGVSVPTFLVNGRLLYQIGATPPGTEDFQNLFNVARTL